MKRLIILLVLILGSMGIFGQSTSIFVAKDGSDHNDGSIDAPFATIQRAVDEIPTVKVSGSFDTIRVVIRRGTYRIEKPIVFEAANGGSEETTVIIKGNQDVVISGGVLTSLEGYGPVISSTQTYPVKMRSSDLYVNGRRATVARTPNDGFEKLKEVREELLDEENSRLFLRLSPAITAELKSLPSEELSQVRIHFIHKWDVTIRYLSGFLDHTGEFVTTPAKAMKSHNPLNKRTRYFVDGYLGALDHPGEWLDDDGTIQYFKFPDQQATKLRGVISSNSDLLRIAGKFSAPVQHLTFVNLNFQHSNWVLPNDGWDPHQAAANLSAAVEVNYASHIDFRKCSFQHLGQFALSMDKGVTNSRVFHCFFYDLGAGAIKLGARKRGEQHLSRVSKFNVIENNILQGGGRNLPCAAAIWVGNSSNNIIKHNDIADFWYTGISVGWTWGYGPNNTHDNEVAHNHIHHLGWSAMSDMAGIYTLGVSPGTRIHHNVIHDISCYRLGFGIYADEGSSNIVVAKNLVFRTSHGGFIQHYGRNNTVRNNIFAMGLNSSLHLVKPERHLSLRFVRNIVYYEQGDLMTGDWENFNTQFSDNLFIAPTNLAANRSRLGNSLSGENFFLTKRLDQPPSAKNVHSYGKLDRDLLKKVNFEEVDWSKAGVYGSEAWKKKAELPPEIISKFRKTHRAALAKGKPNLYSN